MLAQIVVQWVGPVKQADLAAVALVRAVLQVLLRPLRATQVAPLQVATAAQVVAAREPSAPVLQPRPEEMAAMVFLLPLTRLPLFAPAAAAALDLQQQWEPAVQVVAVMVSAKLLAKQALQTLVAVAVAADLQTWDLLIMPAARVAPAS